MKTVKERYEKLSASRINFLNTAERCAAYTLPYLFPKGKSDSQTALNYVEPEIQFSSTGAEAVNFLANRLVNILFPPNKPFFRARVPKELEKAQGADSTRVQAALKELETIASEKFTASVSRAHLLNACLNLVVGGNVLFVRDSGVSRYYSLHNYAVKRATGSGKVLRLIIKEPKEVKSLPEEYLQYVPVDKLARADIETSQTQHNNNSLTLWTEAVWCNKSNKYIVEQYLDDELILQNSYDEKEFVFMPLTWNLLNGEDYGHSFCEDYLGSINSEGILSAAVTQLSVAISKIVNLVDPGSELAYNLEELEEAESGAFFVGKQGDVTQMVTNKLSDMQAVLANLDMHKNTIRRVFLQNSAVQRDAERVTAEEIRYMAQELETAQGGIYSHLASTWQRQLAHLCLLDAFEALGANGKELAKELDIKILTGIESLARSIEAESTLRFIQEVGMVAQIPETVLPEVSIPRIVRKLATDSDMTDPSQVLKTEEEKQQEAQAQQAAMTAQMATQMQ